MQLTLCIIDPVAHRVWSAPCGHTLNLELHVVSNTDLSNFPKLRVLSLSPHLRRDPLPFHRRWKNSSRSTAAGACLVSTSNRTRVKRWQLFPSPPSARTRPHLLCRRQNLLTRRPFRRPASLAQVAPNPTPPHQRTVQSNRRAKRPKVTTLWRNPRVDSFR